MSLPPPMLTRSLPRVERATRHPPLTGPDDVLVGDEHVVEEHLAEELAAARLAQRPDVDAGRVQVDHHHRDAVVLRLVGIGAHGGEPAVAVRRATGPHLLAVDQPAAVDLGRAGADAGGVGARARLAEQLAPHVLVLEARSDPALDLLLVGVLGDRLDDPAADPVLGALDAGGGELLVDHELLDRARRRDPTASASARAHTRSRGTRRAARSAGSDWYRVDERRAPRRGSAPPPAAARPRARRRRRRSVSRVTSASIVTDRAEDRRPARRRA